MNAYEVKIGVRQGYFTSTNDFPGFQGSKDRNTLGRQDDCRKFWLHRRFMYNVTQTQRSTD